MGLRLPEMNAVALPTSVPPAAPRERIHYRAEQRGYGRRIPYISFAQQYRRSCALWTLAGVDREAGRLQVEVPSCSTVQLPVGDMLEPRQEARCGLR